MVDLGSIVTMLAEQRPSRTRRLRVVEQPPRVHCWSNKGEARSVYEAPLFRTFKRHLLCGTSLQIVSWCLTETRGIRCLPLPRSVRDRHEINVSNTSGIRTHCIVP